MLIDGLDSALVPASDRGLQYGDGLFETIAVADGQPLLWHHHVERLHAGCTRLGIHAPDEAVLRTEGERLWRGQGQAVLKIIVTRGSGGRGYRPDPAAQPRRILSLHPWPEYPQPRATTGVHARLCETRLGINPRLAGLKHLNRLEQVLARAEWDEPAIAEGVMLDAEGFLVEGTMSNLFLVRDGVLRTPALDRCGVAGVMRARLLELAEQLALHVDIERLTLDDLRGADEAFFCNSIIGVWPLARFDTHEYEVGPITQRLQQALALTGGQDDA